MNVRIQNLEQLTVLRIKNMFLGRVKGHLVVNQALPALKGKTLRVMEEVNATNLDKPGNLIISFDYIGTRVGDLVLYEGGPESAYAFFPVKTGSDVNILAIVDSIDL
jgi:microcompartment protein CcmK/EutM